MAVTRLLLPELYSNTGAFYGALINVDFAVIPQDWGLITGTPDVYQNWGLITEAADKAFDLGDADLPHISRLFSTGQLMNRI